MTEIETIKISEIIELHNSITIQLAKSLENAIRIGQILTEVKQTLKHGKFQGWIAVNMPFSDRTARRYMTLYERREELKTDSMSDLTSAYKLLAGETLTRDDYLDVETTIKKLQEKYKIKDLPTKEQMLKDGEEMRNSENLDRLIEVNSLYSDYFQRIAAFRLEIERIMGLILKEENSCVPVV